VRAAAPWSRVVTAVATVAALALLAQGEAEAKRGITSGVTVEEATSPEASLRDAWLDRTAEAGAELVRFDVRWRTVVGSLPPANPGDPSDPAYDFSRLDAAVRGAQQRGLKVLFTVFRAPDWAEGPGRPAGIPAGSWNPDPGRFGQFGSALARRYSGSFSPGSGAPPLPRVRYFEAWNEPNLTNFFAPQRVGDQVVSPDAYRTLLNSFYDAVHAVDPTNVVISGGTGAYGDPPGGERTRPVAFLRQLFCLQGQQLEPQPCPQTRMDTLGHHPFGHPNPPTYSTINPDDAGIPDIGRLERVLRAAEKAGVVAPGGKRPIWATEFWWITRPPPNPDAVANEAQQARYIEQAHYLFWKQGVSVAIQYLIRDSGVPFNTGLFFSDGRPKLSFKAFRFPFVTDRLSGKRVLAWGKSPKAGKVKVQARKRGKWRTVKRTRVGEDDVFTARVRGSKKMRARIGSEKSLVWR
jgi:hypothetical protein